jgi:O-antigen biosynthesis protein WbqP
MYCHFFKRFFDFWLSFFAILVLALPMFILAIAIKLDSRGPVFFVQKRVGKGKKHFNILKFRTMRVDTPHDAPTHELSDPKKWITRVGGFLRKTSLDELPQIFNIFVGQMSIIGPRPALWNQYDLIEERDKYGANDVRPGLTGWAQINGRDELEIPVKAALDGVYIERMGFFFDMKCFFGTFLSVLRSDGVVEGGTGAMREAQDDGAETVAVAEAANASQSAEGAEE